MKILRTPMKNILLAIFTFFSVMACYAQQQLPLNESHFLDSLENVLKSSKADSSKSNANYLLSYYWRGKDTLKSRAYLQNAHKLSTDYPYYSALFAFYEGQYYFGRNRAKAARLFKIAAENLAAFHTQKADDTRAAAWFNYALMCLDSKGYVFTADIILNKVIRISETARDTGKLAYYYSQLATVFMNNYQFSKAEAYNNKAIALLERSAPGTTNLLFAYLGGVSIDIYQDKAEQALPLLIKAKKLLAPFPFSVNYPLYYYNEALYYTCKRDFDKALNATEMGIALSEKYNQEQLLEQFYFRQYNVYLEMKNYKHAKIVLTNVLNQGKLMANANDRATIFSQLAKTNEYLHNYKEAYTWLQKYNLTNDSINGSQTKLKINELETKYNTVENQRHINALQAQNQQVELTLKNQQLFQWMLVLGCLLLLIICCFVILNARSNKQLARQKEINYQHQLKDLEQQQQLKITKAMLDGGEQERERVARDLHDGLGGMLSGVKIGLSGLANNNIVLAQGDELNLIISQLDSSVGELRRIARNMMPESLIKFGLEIALNDLCEFHMREGLHINFQPFNIDRDIDPAVQLNIYRIVQELISNAVKHARASNIVLQCSYNQGSFFITIEDDGVGFDPSILKDKKGMGLVNMKNRVEFLHGTIETLSAINEGTIINIEFKINNA